MSENVYVTSNNQSGGITANRVEINNVYQSISPVLEAKVLCKNKIEGSSYITEIELSSSNPIPNLYLAAHGNSITDLNVIPMRAGLAMFGHTGQRAGYRFTNVPNFVGRYLMRIQTSKEEDVSIEYNY